MIPMLDQSANRIIGMMKEYDIEIMQLASPLTQYRHHNTIPFGYDCGAFSMNPFSNPAWKPVEKATYPNCKWVVLPDIVGCALGTTRLFNLMKSEIPTHQRAIVAQDGHTIDGELAIPWDEIGCLFIGGTTEWKDTAGVRLAIYAKENHPDVWVHVGRVNTVRRLARFFDHANSFDGSGLVRFGMFANLVPTIKEFQRSKQSVLEDF